MARSVRSASAVAVRTAAPRLPSARRPRPSGRRTRGAPRARPRPRRWRPARARGPPPARTGRARRRRWRHPGWPRASSAAACSSRRLSPALLPPRAQPGPKTSPSAVTAVMPSWRETRATAWAAVGTSATRSSSCSTAGRTGSGAAHDVAGPHGGAVEPGHVAGSLGDAVAPTSRDARPPSAVAQRLDRPRRVLGGGHRQRLRGPAEGGGDRRLVPAGDVEQGRDGADDGVVVVGRGEQRGRAVLAAQAQLERLEAGGGARTGRARPRAPG